MINLRAVAKPLTQVKVEGEPDIKYIPSNGKQPISGSYISRDEALASDSYCIQVPTGYTILDFDTPESVDIALNIIEGENLKCKVMKTTKGIHVWFKTETPWKNFTKTLLSCGIEADCRSYGKFSALCWRINGVDREFVYDTAWSDIEIMPKFFYPGTNKTEKFYLLGAGDGRNQTLTEYVWSLQNRKFTVPEIKKTFHVINRYVFKSPLSDKEMAVILRDDTFQDPKETEAQQAAMWFTEGGAFLHNEMAKHLLDQNDMVYVNGTIYRYSQGYYQPLDDDLIYHLVHGLYNNSTIRQRKEVLSSLEAQIYKEAATKQDPMIICVNNGRLNLNTGELLPHDPKAYDFQKVPTNYDPDSEHDLLDRTLLKLFPSEGSLDLFEEMLGYCLLKSLPYRCAFYLVGDGANGKSTILNMIRNMIGIQNTSTLVPNQITTDSFHLAELENKLANIGDDITDSRIKDMAAFKKACSGEAMTANVKYKQPFTLESYATLIFAANEMPGTNDQSYGADSRRIIIPLTARFTVKDTDFDPFIGEKLATAEALSHLLSKAVTGLHRLLANNAFTLPDIVVQAEAKYRSKNTYIGQWIYDEIITEDDIINRAVNDVRGEFKQWCADNGIRSKCSPVYFGQVMSKEFPNIDTKTTRIDGKPVRAYVKKSE